MNPRHRSVLALLVLALAGCPVPPTAQQDARTSPPPAPAAPTDGSPGVLAPQQPAEGGAPPPPGAAAVTSFAQAIGDGAPTVTLHIVVQGLTQGQIDFTAFEGDGKNGRAYSVHVQRFESSTFDVVAPANYERRLVVSAVPMGEGGLQADDGAAVSANGEVVIGSEDQTLTLSKPIL